MSHYRIGWDAHKHYSQFAVLDQGGRLLAQRRVDHQAGAIRRKGHAIALGAVAGHLAESAYWVLNRQEPYLPPAVRQALPKQVRGRA